MLRLVCANVGLAPLNVLLSMIRLQPGSGVLLWVSRQCSVVVR